MRPSTWFTWRQGVIAPSTRVLDVACGTGRHAVAAAKLGANVVAIDQDPTRLEAVRQNAATAGVSVMAQQGDLTDVEIPEAAFDVVMVFNYLDRNRMGDFMNAVKPGGFFMFETFMEGQEAFGWGPKSKDHLLKPGEISQIVEPFHLVYLREVIEPVDSLTAVLASVLARRRL